ncbi:MAG: hypothetical protein QM621_13460 [Aeromicrobium sp.]|uniref:hypothetical protein n=1 Tax=Aeromicrobium sp. TaxID=1871063 RepID=UPI0039E238BA
MSRVDEFDAFYKSTSENVLRVLYAITGDRAVARDATIDAYRHSWRDWPKIRGNSPHRYVRIEAWKATSISRGTHPLRRRHEQNTDTELLDALAGLTPDDRRLVVLMTLGASDLDDAAQEIGVSDEEAIERVTTAITSLEQVLGQPLERLERRMNALGTVTRQLEMPPAAKIRSQGTRGHRLNTLAVVGSAVAAVLAGMFVLTDGRPTTEISSAAYRERIGAESHDLVLDSQKVGEADLLTRSQVAELTPQADWTEGDTSSDTRATEPLTACPTRRFATEDPLKAFARSFVGDGEQRLVQVIEVARQVDAAEKAFNRSVSWFGDCDLPQVQLVGSWRANRPYGDLVIVRLLLPGDTPQALTVGLNWSGTVTTTVVHESDVADAPEIDDFATTVDSSLRKLCGAHEGASCDGDVIVAPADPPPLNEAPAFLGAIDLPALPGVDAAWSSAEVEGDKPNPTGTTCDRSSFQEVGATGVSSRIFLMPEASSTLPPSFGMVETVGVFPDADAATAFVDQVRASVENCPAENLAAEIAETDSFGESPDFRGSMWTLNLQLEGRTQVPVRSAIVQRGASVARILFTPGPSVDLMTVETFSAVVQRAAQRLVYAD